MKIIFLSIVLFLSLKSSIVCAQDFSKIDSIVNSYPDKFNTPIQLANKINQDFIGDLEKSRAIYTWITSNIAYDIKKYYKWKRGKYRKYKWKNEYLLEKVSARKTINRKKGICGDYSNLYKHICDLTRIECVVISGYSKTRTRDIGSKYGGKHAWNAVRIDNKWYLLDLTWSSGFVDLDRKIFTHQYNSFYFFTDPEIFFYSHFPREEKWLLTDKTREEFSKLPLYTEYYFESDIELLEPEEGKIFLGRKEKLTICLKNLSRSDDISYKLHSQKCKKTIIPEIIDNCFYFQVEKGKRSSDYLTIYIEYQAISTFKINWK